MSIVKSFLGRLIGSGKEQPKKLLSGTDGNLFHTLILAYVRIYLQNQDAKTKDRKLSSSKHNNDEKSNSNDQKNDNNNNNNSNEEQDPTAVLLSILTIIDYKKQSRQYYIGYILKINDLVINQYDYGVCSNNSNISYIYYGIIFLWKLFELIFGMHVARMVSQRIGFKTMYATFDETSRQIISIIFTVIILIISLLSFFVLNNSNVTLNYLLLSIVILLLCHFVLFANIWSRLYAVLRGKEENFKFTPEQKLTKILQKNLKKMVQKSDQKTIVKLRKFTLEYASDTNIEYAY
eukprot:443922_1